MSRAASRIEDLANVGTEHFVSDRTSTGMVKLRAQSESTLLIGQLTPDQAREIATHLNESAARAEYEADFYAEAIRREWEPPMIAGVMVMIRNGEMTRHTPTPGEVTE